MKKYSLFVLLISFVIGVTLQSQVKDLPAEKLTGKAAKTAQQAGEITKPHFPPLIYTDKTDYLVEDFEGGTIPPGDWTLEDMSDFTWEIDDYNPYEGSYNASCFYDENLNQQDEWLISPTIDLSSASSASIHFWWLGSYYWSVDPNDNCDLLVKVSGDGGTTWETVWDEHDVGVFDDWVWYNETIGLSDYIGNDNVKIAFNYYGMDGAQFSVDYIVVNDQGACEIDPASNPSPANMAAEVVSNDVTLSWTNPNDATGAELYFAEPGDTAFTILAGGPNTLINSYNVGMLADGSTYYWGIVTYDGETCFAEGEVWSFTTEYDLGDDVAFYDFFDNLEQWTVSDVGMDNWSISSSNEAGGQIPELEFNWSPSFVGMTYVMSTGINPAGKSNFTLEFMHYLDHYSSASDPYTIGIGYTTDEGATINDIYVQTVDPGGDDIGPEAQSFEFSVQEPFSLVLWFDGDSFDLMYWYVDNLILYGDSGGPGPVNWSTDLMVEDAGGTKVGNTIVFGMDSEATDGLDSLLGEQELPPLPPSGVFDTRFILPNDIPSLIDLRNSELEEAVWDLTFQPGDAGYPFTFTWDPADLPDGAFYLTDDFGLVDVNMKSKSSFTLDNDAISQLHIEYTETVTMEVDMPGGWNIVSAPLMSDDMSVDGMYPMGSSEAFAFNNGYDIADSLEMGIGYWLKFAEPATVAFLGMDMGTFSSDVAEGWNIIAPYAYPVAISDLTTSPGGIISSEFFGFDNGYSIADTLYPPHGYWVKTSQAGTISEGMAKKGAGDAENLTQAQAEIMFLVSDGVGGSNTLTVGQDPSATDGLDASLGEVELPPLPPSGVFDARMILPDDTPSPKDIREGGDTFEPATEFEVNWQLGEGSQGFTLEWFLPGDVSMTMQDLLGGGIVDTTFGPGEGTYTVTNDNLDALKLTFDGIVPVELSSFTADVSGESVQLAWVTSSEKNNSGFEIQRSTDNENFEKVGYAEGNGTTNEPREYSFVDNSVQNGTYYYRLKQIDLDGSYEYSDVVEVEIAVPKEYALDQNYPNPFNPSTTIKFALPVKSDVTIKLFNSLGQEIREFVSRDYSAGTHTLNLNASSLSSGIYFYSIEANGKDGSNFVKTRKMILMK